MQLGTLSRNRNLSPEMYLVLLTQKFNIAFKLDGKCEFKT